MRQQMMATAVLYRPRLRSLLRFADRLPVRQRIAKSLAKIHHLSKWSNFGDWHWQNPLTQGRYKYNYKWILAKTVPMHRGQCCWAALKTHLTRNWDISRASWHCSYCKGFQQPIHHPNRTYPKDIELIELHGLGLMCRWFTHPLGTVILQCYTKSIVWFWKMIMITVGHSGTVVSRCLTMSCQKTL